MKISGAMAIVLLAAAACSEPKTAVGAIPDEGGGGVSRGKSAEPAGLPAFRDENFSRMCRSALSQRPAAMVLFDITAAAGARTCYKDGRTVVFTPTSSSTCEDFAGLEIDGSVNISFAEGKAEYLACSAIANPSGLSQSVVFTPSSKAGPEDEGFFLQFGLDTGAMASNDGLPVSAHFMEEHRVCLETDVPNEVVKRVREADIVNFDYVDVEIRAGRCERG